MTEWLAKLYPNSEAARKLATIGESVRLEHGDSREVLKSLADESIDACVTDPPYSLQTINKRFSKVGRNDKTWSRSGPHQRTASGFMNQKWDTGETAHDPAFWAEVFRVLKPGAHLVAFGGTRTYHRMVCAIEDAGFEIRDQIGWCFGSGFPKSHNVGKAIDRELGHERPKIKTPMGPTGNKYCKGLGDDRPWMREAAARGYHEAASDEAASDEAAKWNGWGTALKPAWEPICLARKPLIGTVAENVLKYGTGALNIDGCRIGFASDEDMAAAAAAAAAQRLCHDEPGQVMKGLGKTGFTQPRASIAPYLANLGKGRWPANLCHDGSEEVTAAFPRALGAVSNGRKGKRGLYDDGIGASAQAASYADDGSAARFFYTAKADADDRCDSKHPTVKPVSLMRWLARLITPPGGVILDPFAGTGTSGEAAVLEGFKALLVEREEKYFADIKRRFDTLREREVSKEVFGDSDPGAVAEYVDLFAVAQPAEKTVMKVPVRKPPRRR